MSKFLNIQTNDFDSWFDSVNLNMEFWESPVRATRFGYEAGRQSRQAEIDLLQKLIDDALEKCYTGIRKQGGDGYLELVEGILKGGTNE